MGLKLQPGITINQYTLEHSLGSGASGEVWVASNGSTPVAMKFIHQRHLDSPNAQKHQQRLQAEIDILSRLQHPHIPPLYDYDQDFERPYLVMQYIREASYEDLIASREMLKIPLERRLNALAIVAQTLQYIHSEGIIHRDIKPGSINGIETPYLLDFGISLEAADVANAKDDVGTGLYMPPPHIALGDAIDNFGFIIVAYEVIFGCHPIFARHNLGKTLMENRRLTGKRLQNRAWRFPSSIPIAERPGDLGGVELGRLDELFDSAFHLQFKKPTAFIDALIKTVITPQNRPFLDNPVLVFPVDSLPKEVHYTDEEVERESRDTDNGQPLSTNDRVQQQLIQWGVPLVIMIGVILLGMLLLLANN